MERFSDFYIGFAASPGEVVLVVLAVAVFVAALTAAFVVRSRKETRERRRRAEEAYQQHLKAFSLTPSDLAAVEQMASHLHAPERKYLLLVSQGIYNSCAERALEAGDVTEQQVAALRVKLGFAGKETTKPPASTTEIPVGAAVLLRAKEEAPVQARVLAQEPESFLVEHDEEAQDLTFGTPLTVLYQTNAGIYAFESVVERREGSVLYLAHDEEPSRMQRREYYRQNVDLPVYVRPTGSGKKPLATRFIDVGGGGASLRNPSPKFVRGTDLELTFHPDSEAPLNLHGRVVRTSSQGRVLHIKFEKLRESSRDKIFRLLFRTQR
ncbi:MAG: flagellar brake protein [Spirochaetaceae bacterium]